MSKRFYLLIIFVFATSALLLGLSYSKDSGNEMTLKLNQNYDDYFRVVYSTQQVLTKTNNKIDFGITNITGENQNYVIKLINKGKGNVYYKLDGEEEKVLGKEIIFKSSLKANGTDGDYVMHRLSVNADKDFRVKVEIALLDVSLKGALLESDQVFIDDNDNIRFFGEKVDNYIKYGDRVYRIIGLINDKFRLVSEPMNTAKYDVTANYLALEDYILSFDKHDLKEENVYGNKSWMNADYRFWVESDDLEVGKMVDADVGVRTDSKNKVHYQRFVKQINGDALIVKGNGTISNPYEVSYDS